MAVIFIVLREVHAGGQADGHHQAVVVVAQIVDTAVLVHAGHRLRPAVDIVPKDGLELIGDRAVEERVIGIFLGVVIHREVILPAGFAHHAVAEMVEVLHPQGVQVICGFRASQDVGIPHVAPFVRHAPAAVCGGAQHAGIEAVVPFQAVSGVKAGIARRGVGKETAGHYAGHKLVAWAVIRGSLVLHLKAGIPGILHIEVLPALHLPLRGAAALQQGVDLSQRALRGRGDADIFGGILRDIIMIAVRVAVGKIFVVVADGFQVFLQFRLEALCGGFSQDKHRELCAAGKTDLRRIGLVLRVCRVFDVDRGAVHGGRARCDDLIHAGLQ